MEAEMSFFDFLLAGPRMEEIKMALVGKYVFESLKDEKLKNEIAEYLIKKGYVQENELKIIQSTEDELGLYYKEVHPIGYVQTTNISYTRAGILDYYEFYTSGNQRFEMYLQPQREVKSSQGWEVSIIVATMGLISIISIIKKRKKLRNNKFSNNK